MSGILLSRSPVLRGALTAIAARLAAAVVAPIAFLVALVLAGPHVGVLPHALEAAVLATGWIAIVAIPALVARGTWRRLA